MPSAFDRLMDTIRPHLPGAIDRAIKQELFQVCEDFFTNSNTWTEVLPFTFTAGQKTASVTPTTGRITQLMEVKNDDDIPINGIFMSEPGTLQTRFAPASDTTYNGTFAITVNDPIDADAFPIVPVDQVTRHTATLIHGIVANMMAQPSKPWSNTGLAQYHMTRYRGGLARARNEANTGFTYGSQRWVYPQTFRTR